MGTLSWVTLLSLAYLPDKPAVGLSAKIVVLSEQPLDTEELRAEMVLTNVSDKPLKVCTLCGHIGMRDDLGDESTLRPDSFKSLRPPFAKSAERVVTLKPGENVALPLMWNGVRSDNDNKFVLKMAYEVGPEFAARLGLWTGRVEAPKVVVRLKATRRIIIVEDGREIGEPNPDDILYVVGKLWNVREFSFKVRVPDAKEEVEVRVNNRANWEKGQPGLLHHEKGDVWAGDRWYGDRILPLVLSSAFEVGSKGPVVIAFTVPGQKEPLVVSTKSPADAVYALPALGLGKRFEKWVDKTVGPPSADVQEWAKEFEDRIDGSKEVKATDELKPAIELAQARYTARRTELSRRFGVGYLTFPARPKWHIERKGDALFVSSGGADRMFVLQYAVELRKAEGGKWEYVRVVAKNWFKGE